MRFGRGRLLEQIDARGGQAPTWPRHVAPAETAPADTAPPATPGGN
jgi:hypothetical protein